MLHKVYEFNIIHIICNYVANNCQLSIIPDHWQNSDSDSDAETPRFQTITTKQIRTRETLLNTESETEDLGYDAGDESSSTKEDPTEAIITQRDFRLINKGLSSLPCIRSAFHVISNSLRDSSLALLLYFKKYCKMPSSKTLISIMNMLIDYTRRGRKMKRSSSLHHINMTVNKEHDESGRCNSSREAPHYGSEDGLIEYFDFDSMLNQLELTEAACQRKIYARIKEEKPLHQHIINVAGGVLTQFQLCSKTIFDTEELNRFCKLQTMQKIIHLKRRNQCQSCHSISYGHLLQPCHHAVCSNCVRGKLCRVRGCGVAVEETIILYRCAEDTSEKSYNSCLKLLFKYP